MSTTSANPKLSLSVVRDSARLVKTVTPTAWPQLQADPRAAAICPLVSFSLNRHKAG
jgi:hypothetical protein